MHVGDIVRMSGYSELSIIIVVDGVIGLMGWHHASTEGIINGILQYNKTTKITLVKKYYDTSVLDFPIREITIKPIREIKDSSESFGIVGTPTSMVCKKGNQLHVGDIVKVIGKYGEHTPTLIVSSDSEFVMGWKGIKFENGYNTHFGHIELIKKYYDVADGKYHNNHLKISPSYESVEIVYPQEPKQPKSKLSQITVPIKVDVQSKQQPKTKQSSPRPVIEDDDSETYIFVGNTVVYLNKECGLYGVSTCGHKDIYDKEIGKALAFYRASHSEK
jgi:hypothetical protein